MAGLNKVMLIGHLGADPEARSMNNGGEVVTMRVATSEQWKDRDGNKQERTEWHSVVIFNENLGRIAKEYLRKGSKVYLSGQLQTRKWQDQSGNDRYSTEIVMQKFNGELLLMDSKGSGGDRYEGSRNEYRQREDRRDDEGGDRQESFGGEGFNREDRGGGGDDQTRAYDSGAFDTDLDDDVPF